MQAPNWDNFIFGNGTISTCYLNASLGFPCEQGSIPIIGVDARSVKDVQAAVKFASTHNLRVVVKNTGHDYLGRSTARKSFLIWTHFMKNITFHGTFVPVGGPKSAEYNDVVTLEAGVQWGEAYPAVNARGRDIVGGISAGGSVGAAGGWVQGGGHSALAPKYGLGVDNVVQITVVIADGSALTVNEYQHSELFWALRGGGGGTFGVVTSVTYRTHPSTPLILAIFSAFINSTLPSGTTTASPILEDLFVELVRMTPAMSDGGWAGYTTVVPMPPTNQPSLQMGYIAPNVSWEKANSTMNPFFAFAEALAANSTFQTTGKLIILAAETSPINSFATLWNMSFANTTGQVGSQVEITSRLLPRSLIEDNPVKVAKTLLSVPFPSFYLVAGGAVADADPSSTGLNPAWRKALIHTITGVGWDEGSSAAEIMQQRDQLKQYTAILNNLAPHSGAYLNEATLYEPNPQYTFFGSHYERLKFIKEKYDSASLFVVASGVGSEDWDASLNCRV
ncbi:hypothetical protein NM688_g9166 [Phlebia brevispora]|uniref:Uncharacterized protein n=1 Tax=Phlebia brevispora TaxID=194682 RepID=A0ACC1RIQ0_9APHY|nr:hypothetical protein NM688_g9166 [Phlebia brevispora]